MPSPVTIEGRYQGYALAHDDFPECDSALWPRQPLSVALVGAGPTPSWWDRVQRGNGEGDLIATARR